MQLGTLVKITSGFAFKSNLFNTEQQGLPLIRIRDVTRGFSETYYDGDYKSDYLIQNGDALIGMDGEFNISLWNGGKALLNQRVCKIQSISQDLDQSYLIKFLPKVLKDIEDKTPFVTVKHLSVKDIQNIQIPLPSLEEQRRIAEILDKADSLIQKRKKSIAKLDELLQATFIDIFGDPVTNPKGWKLNYLRDLCSKITVGIVIKPASYYVDQGIPALRSLNIGINKVIPKNFVYFSQHDNDTTLAKTKLKTNDVVIVRSGQPGKAAVTPQELEGANAIDVLIVRTKDSLLVPLFLSFFLNSHAGKQLVMKEQRGQVQKHLNVTQLSEAYLPTPPVDKQNLFLQKINIIEKQKQAMQAQLEMQETLFKALQQQAFSGQL